MSITLDLILPGLVSGAVAASFVNLMMSRWKRFRLHRNLQCTPSLSQEPSGIAWVRNDYIYPLTSVRAYLTLEHDDNDIFQYPLPVDESSDEGIYESELLQSVSEKRKPFINFDDPNHGHVTVQQLCWSVRPNPSEVDIYAGERQGLDIFGIYHRPGSKKGFELLEIPSEEGWSTRNERGRSRAFLNLKDYHGWIKVVSKETKAVIFAVDIGPMSNTEPMTGTNCKLSIRRLPEQEAKVLESREKGEEMNDLRFKQNWWGLVIGFIGMAVAQHYHLWTLFYFSDVLSWVMTASVIITTSVYTWDYCRKIWKKHFETKDKTKT